MNYFDPESLKDIDSYRTGMREALNVHVKLSERYFVFAVACFLPGLVALYEGFTTVTVALFLFAYYFHQESGRYALHANMISMQRSLALLANNEANRVLQEILAERHKTSSA